VSVSDSTASDRPIVWRVHLRSAPERVFVFLATDEGRAQFWAERSRAQLDGAAFDLEFPNGQRVTCRVLAHEPPRQFAVEYFGGSRAEFVLAGDGRGGTDLTLTETGVSAAEWPENHAGWVSVLLALKAACDHGVDLRAHDAQRTWDQRYVEN
jgi:uncharacterized protein YndB with AHSA1/START domain